MVAIIDNDDGLDMILDLIEKENFGTYHPVLLLMENIAVSSLSVKTIRINQMVFFLPLSNMSLTEVYTVKDQTIVNDIGTYSLNQTRYRYLNL